MSPFLAAASFEAESLQVPRNVLKGVVFLAGYALALGANGQEKTRHRAMAEMILPMLKYLPQGAGLGFIATPEEAARFDRTQYFLSSFTLAPPVAPKGILSRFRAPKSTPEVQHIERVKAEAMRKLFGNLGGTFEDDLELVFRNGYHFAHVAAANRQGVYEWVRNLRECYPPEGYWLDLVVRSWPKNARTFSQPEKLLVSSGLLSGEACQTTVAKRFFDRLTSRQDLADPDAFWRADIETFAAAVLSEAIAFVSEEGRAAFQSIEPWEFTCGKTGSRQGQALSDLFASVEAVRGFRREEPESSFEVLRLERKVTIAFAALAQAIDIDGWVPELVPDHPGVPKIYPTKIFRLAVEEMKDHEIPLDIQKGVLFVFGLWMSISSQEKALRTASDHFPNVPEHRGHAFDAQAIVNTLTEVPHIEPCRSFNEAAQLVTNLYSCLGNAVTERDLEGALIAGHRFFQTQEAFDPQVLSDLVETVRDFAAPHIRWAETSLQIPPEKQEEFSRMRAVLFGAVSPDDPLLPILVHAIGGRGALALAGGDWGGEEYDISTFIRHAITIGRDSVNDMDRLKRQRLRDLFIREGDQPTEEGFTVVGATKRLHEALLRKIGLDTRDSEEGLYRGQRLDRRIAILQEAVRQAVVN